MQSSIQKMGQGIHFYNLMEIHGTIIIKRQSRKYNTIIGKFLKFGIWKLTNQFFYFSSNLNQGYIGRIQIWILIHDSLECNPYGCMSLFFLEFLHFHHFSKASKNSLSRTAEKVLKNLVKKQKLTRKGYFRQKYPNLTRIDAYLS